MKAVFFDVDDITKEYMKNVDLPGIELVYLDNSLSSDAKIDYSKIEDAEIISVFVHSTNVSGDLLSKFPKLKMVATRSTGFNHIDIKYCEENNIAVCNTPGYGKVAVAEFTFAMLLNLAKKVFISAKDFKEKEPNIDQYIGFDLFNKTIGVIGTGSIGQHVIKLALGFGMKVLAYDPYPNSEIKELNNVKYVELAELYANSDVISLNAPATKENIHLLNEGAFAQMKQGVVIINTARGDLIDTAALYQNLINKKVGAAGLDVMEFENFFIQDDAYTKNPHDFHKEEMFKSLLNMKLMQLDNVLVTPHIAFNSIDAIHRILELTIENIKSFMNGKILYSVI